MEKLNRSKLSEFHPPNLLSSPRGSKQVSIVNSNAFHLEQRSTNGSHVFRFLAPLLQSSNSRLIEVLVARAPARPSKKRKNTPTPIVRGGKRERGSQKGRNRFHPRRCCCCCCWSTKSVTTPRLPRWTLKYRGTSRRSS